jgi:hypothetical protein
MTDNPFDISDFPSLDELVEKSDYETRLAITRWVMKHIVDHAKEGGSYRYLIYERLGFEMDAYSPLLESGMTISNDFSIEDMEDIKDIVRKRQIVHLKKILRMCDIEECYQDASVWLNGKQSCFHHCEEYLHGAKKRE